MNSTNPFESELVNWKNLFQDCNINFLIGSGLSNPFFGTLGQIEVWLTKLEENHSIEQDLKDFIKASLYGSYYQVAMRDNVDVYKAKDLEDIIVEKPSTKNEMLSNTYKGYKDFLRTLNQILYNRRSNTVNKQVNLFTTNIDIFFEKVIDDLNLHYNDGFNGIFRKRFSLSNFKKSFYQKSLHYDNIAEIPVYNLLKIHGSITWRLVGSEIQFKGIALIKSINELLNESELLDIVQLDNDIWNLEERCTTIDDIIKEAEKLKSIPDVSEFINEYEKLQVVNPTKEKFKDTTFNKTYYEMLRLYANELEKENSILYIMGFSMADEHIRDITFRAIKSNPTLKVFICSYTESASDIIANLKSDNVDLKDFHNVELINPFDGFTIHKFNEHILFPLLQSIKTN
ncbi:SIR2 family protein [Flavobacterium sp. 123]|uniref:SIR2 family protein n=1 Tax=Flavobacterium sp. 123 TaxID=2135627 RepID=UPI000EB16603|nr:SIR2 family protein [Flavobacterium sp. 123]RKS98646.1 SIR2-like protein [Flavobacterium sp. 123]